MGSSSTSSEQLWFLVRETASGPADDFGLLATTLSEIKAKGLTMASCLELTKTKGAPSEYSFHIHSKSMAAAVRLLSDASIKVTYELYCKNDPVVQIFIRLAKDPSPNTSQCPSFENSMRARQKQSRGKLIPDLFIAPQHGHVEGSSDVITGEELQDQADMVTISLGGAGAVTLSKEYLKGWIDSQLGDGKGLTDVVVQATGPDMREKEIKLTEEIWQRSLIRGSWSTDFLTLWNQFNQADLGRRRLLAECVQLDPAFSKMCSNFIYDLRQYGKEKSSQSRLDSTGHEFYLGRPYFGSAVVDKLLSIPTMKGTLNDDLRKLAAKRLESSGICASHDLAPLYGVILLVRWEKENKKAVAVHGSLPVLPAAPVHQQTTEKGRDKTKGKSKQFFDTLKGKKGGWGGKDGKGGKA